MPATISIRGLYLWDDTLFDGLSLPDGLDKTTLVNNLVMELDGIEVLYPEPAFMKSAITAWSAKQLPVWSKLYETLFYEYDPIWNKDAHYTDTETRDLEAGRQMTDNDTGTGSSQASGSGTDTSSTAAFNSPSYTPREQDTTQSSSSASYSNSLNKTVHENSTDTGTITHVRREYGNIGITTTQQMIEEQRQSVKFSIMDYIIADFKSRFCLLVY